MDTIKDKEKGTIIMNPDYPYRNALWGMPEIIDTYMKTNDPNWGFLPLVEGEGQDNNNDTVENTSLPETQVHDSPLPYNYRNDLGNLQDRLYEAGLYPSMRPEINSIVVIVKELFSQDGNIMSFVITPTDHEGMFNINCYQGIIQFFSKVISHADEQYVVNMLEKYADNDDYKVINLHDIVK